MIFVQRDDHRVEVDDLAPYLRRSLELDMVMDPTQMRPEDVATCRWVGFGIGKGVTSPSADTTVFATPTELRSGLHADLVVGFADVDSAPLCYDEANHVHGFGSFVRWVYFADPAGGPGVFGVDWSLAARSTSGIANGMASAANIFTVIAMHGIPLDAEAVLLNWRMCEEPVIAAWRERMALRTVRDWQERAPALFTHGTMYCPRCGLETFTHPRARYCCRCGCDPKRIRRAHRVAPSRARSTTPLTHRNGGHHGMGSIR